MAIDICEACKQKPVEVIESADDPNQPYRLCNECHKRLESFSLRPIEWYNLASNHGPSKFLLHDDFYDDDGTATQADELIEITPNSAAPTLEQVSTNLEKLLDFVTTQYYLSNAIVDALKNFSKAEVLEALNFRVSTIPNHQIEALAYKICASVVGPDAEEWIRGRWNNKPIVLFSLAKATALCMPLEEGYNLVLNRLKELPEKDLPNASTALSWFRKESSLDWIEQKVTSPISGSWGRLAAVSNLTWARAVKWLDMGRPYSFLALDALNACWKYDTSILKELSPHLLQTDLVENMTLKLLSHKNSDPVPKIQQNIDSIINNWGKICIQEHRS